MKSVLFVVRTMVCGGAETVIGLLAQQLLLRGYDVTFILTRFDGQVPKALEHKVTVIRQAKQYKDRIGRILGDFVFLFEELKRSSADVIIGFDCGLNYCCLLANLLFRKRMIVSERGNPYNKSFHVRLFEKTLYCLADKIVLQTTDVYAFFPKLVQKKAVLIANPVNGKLPIFSGEARDKTIVTSCRLTVEKNIKMLIDAFIMLENDYPEYTLHIYGEGAEKEKLLRYVENKLAANRIIFHGFNDDVCKQITGAAMFILPSNAEGISNAMLEAMEMGIPTICTDCPVGGARMVIEDHVNGLLVPVGNTTSLYKAMKELLDNPSLAEKLSKNSVEVKNRFSLDKIMDKWLEAINGRSAGTT